MKHELIKNIYITIKDETIRQEANLNAIYKEFKNDFDKLSLYLDNKGDIEFNLIEREVYLNYSNEVYKFSLNSLNIDFKAKLESFFKLLPKVKEDIKKFVIGNDNAFYSHIWSITKQYKNTKAKDLIYDYILHYCKSNKIEVLS